MSNQILPPINYYQNEDTWGNYQYITFNQLVDNFMMNYIGDDKLLTNVKRGNVIFHLKRGIRELHYDAVREVKALELELSDTLLLTLPNDFVSLVRVSYVGKDGLLYVLSRDTRTTIGKAYLQDHEFNILFDEDGYPLEPNETEAFKRYSLVQHPFTNDDDTCLETDNHARYGLNPDLNKNGYYQIDRRRGIMSFSSNIGSRVIVIEYVSDGLEFNNGKDIMIHKHAEQTLYAYVRFMLLDNKFGIQEYIVNRAKKDYHANFQNLKIRMLDLKGLEMMIKLRGRNKWIK
jgi:hypothetical protein